MLIQNHSFLFITEQCLVKLKQKRRESQSRLLEQQFLLPEGCKNMEQDWNDLLRTTRLKTQNDVGGFLAQADVMGT